MTDARTRAVEALAEALLAHWYADRPLIVQGGDNLLEVIESDATIVIDYLDAHPEAKAALAAWLCQEAIRKASYNPSLDEALNSGDGTYRP